jgi:predicted nucleotide-binding protein
MTCDELRSALTSREVAFTEKPTQGGTRFQCKTGEIFNVFDTGKMSFQGKKSSFRDEIEALHNGGQPVIVDKSLIQGTPAPTQQQAGGPNKQVFVVYGHDISCRKDLELVLHRMGLEPIVLGNLPAAGDTIIEKLEKYLGEHGNVGYACVLLTPDDEGHKAGKTEDKKYRARQNVVLELGMVLAKLGRKRVAILHKESVELPSDINGLLYIGFKESIDEVKNKLYTELKAAGYSPNSNALN